MPPTSQTTCGRQLPYLRGAKKARRRDHDITGSRDHGIGCGAEKGGGT